MSRHFAVLAPAALLAVGALALPQSDAGAPGVAADTQQSHASGKHRAQGPWVVAHRGASQAAPEETMAAYNAAVRARADVLEGDVQLTADGKLVLVHDDTLVRTTDVQERFPDRAPWEVGDLTLAEIRSLDSGSWFDERFAGDKIATVDDLLSMRGRPGLTLELKAPAKSPGVATKLAAALKRHRLVDDSRTRSGAYKIMIHSRDRAALDEFHTALPKVPLVLLTGGAMLDDATLDELSTWTVGVFAHPRLTTAADVARATSRGLQVYCDPVDSPEQMQMARDQGYTWLVTNQAAEARAFVDDRRYEPHTGPVVVDHVFPNPSGDDVQPENGEYVALRNTTSRPVDISGYTLRDQAGTYVMRVGDDKVLQPGSIFRVYVGPGTDRPDASYNGYTFGFLNNTGGDTVSLSDRRHQLVDVHSYIAPAG